jgi:hypothetical protein
MMIEPRPQDSKVIVKETFEGLEIACPTKSNWVSRTVIVLFLVGWLVGWTAGEITAIRGLLSDETPWFARLFLLVWVTLWTVGGLTAAAFVVILLLPSRPETLMLRPNDLLHARAALSFTSSDDPELQRARSPRSLLQRRRRIVPRDQVTDVRLEDEGDRTRLLVRFGSDEREIGRDLPRGDKEWLASLLNAWREGM